MRSRISAVIILVSIALLIFGALKGIKIGNFQILTISELMEKDEVLNKKIEEATTLTSKNYPDNIGTLEETFETFKIQKQKYEELSGVTNKNDKEIYETKQYDISYLWRVLGKYAEKRGITLGLDVKKDTRGESSYTFNFSLSGKYVNISQFITDIENDSDLYFRIYNFQMSGEGETINSTFTVRNVNIDPSTIS